MTRLRLWLLDRSIELRLPAGPLARAAVHRYGPLRTRRAPELVLEVSCARFDGPFREPRLVRRGARILLEYFRFEGRLDLSRGQGRLVVDPTEAHLDTALRVVATALGRSNGVLLLHAAAVRLRDGRGLLFPAPDGGGKTTLMSKVRADSVLGDDIVGLALRGRPRLLSTPFRGRFRRPGPPRSAPLEGIFFLERGALGVARLARVLALQRLVEQAIVFEQAIGGWLLRTLARAIRQPAFVLATRRTTAWRAIRRCCLAALEH